MLRQIQNKFGGSVKKRSGVNTLRYRLHNTSGMLKLVHAVNGEIRTSKRIIQFHQICNLLDIEVITPKKLAIDNS